MRHGSQMFTPTFTAVLFMGYRINTFGNEQAIGYGLNTMTKRIESVALKKQPITSISGID